jgi:protein-tyrosine-phosphatase
MVLSAASNIGLLPMPPLANFLGPAVCGACLWSDHRVTLNPDHPEAEDLRGGTPGHQLGTIQARGRYFRLMPTGEQDLSEATLGTGGPASPGPVMQVLVVCTGNRARSPTTAQLLADAAARRGRQDVLVNSAGLAATPGEELLPTMRWALLSRGLSVPRHRSRGFDEGEALGSQLIIAMSGTQRRYISRLDPSMVARTYTLLELVRLVASRHWCSEWNGRCDVVERLHHTRPHAAPADGTEDIPDPAAGGSRLAQSVLGQLLQAVGRVAPPLFGGSDR